MQIESDSIMKPASFVAVLFLFAVASAHLFRVILGAEIIVDEFVVPMWASGVASIGVGALAGWLWWEQHAA